MYKLQVNLLLVIADFVSVNNLSRLSCARFIFKIGIKSLNWKKKRIESHPK